MNLGARRRVATGLDWLFSEVDEAIVLEDDCAAEPLFRFRDVTPSWKRIARDLSPPLLYRDASHLSRLIRRPGHDASRRRR